ncbi:putative RNA recognition motif domain, splicing factor, SPF45, SPF45, RNA recognition [Lupinus albus]|uniref:Putative RNA recognition motif domain, splicing factor, SPF45, SPF45, RNA recognition n=1 Tax=Lupinus albus TaxID=3870 RepID=A0A6A4QGZ5_LUPAL|nr:putative RNA recognition motif domain, splicing factor, SPF45, SPF45, RNA recognition [Lupinus albus]
MLGGLYGDLPPPSSAEEDKPINAANVWSSSTKMAPATLRKPATVFSPPLTVLRSQSKSKNPNPAKTVVSTTPVVSVSVPDDVVHQPALMGVQSTVIEERAGVIVNASDISKAEKKVVKSANFHGVPTRVLLLRNMVGPGEVDDELEEEVGSECAKYGTVTRVLIFEITEVNFPVDEAVRIFVQFERPEETTKALVDLDGRYFGGRVVRASFYDEEKFNKNELAPMPGEIPGFS